MQSSNLWLHLGCILSVFDIHFAEIAVGHGVDIFRYWGDLGHYFQNDVTNALLPVFHQPLAVTRHLETEGRTVLQGNFQIELCRDVPELLEAYFRTYHVERSKRSWKMFSSGWNKAKVGKKLGLNSTYLSSQHGFAFLRISRYRQALALDPQIRKDGIVVPQLLNNLQKIQYGDTQSVLEFFTSSGTHYISSFVTGDAFYQVFVYTIPTFLALQERFRIYGTKNLSSEDFVKFFSPWLAEHVGNIMVASENELLQTWAAEHFILQMPVFSYPSLVKLHLNPEYMHHIDHLLGNSAILQLDLRTLEFVFDDIRMNHWFQQVLDNYLKLWEENG